MGAGLESRCVGRVCGADGPSLLIKFSASSWLILRNKYIEMHGQQNIKKTVYSCILVDNYWHTFHDARTLECKTMLGS